MDVLTGMRSFVAVVKMGSFTKAAEYLGISKALTSKYVSQLEDHLGLRLLQRTTRRLSLTEVGQSYFDQVQTILEDLDNLENTLMGQSQMPRGKIRLTAPTDFGELYLSRWMPQFLDQYPLMQVDLYLSDRFVNLLEEGFDLAIRIGQLQDSSLVARRLAQTEAYLYATTSYLDARSRPQTLSDLAQHCCIRDSNISTLNTWHLQHQPTGKTTVVKVDGRFQVNSASSVKQMILADHGIGCCPSYVMGNLSDLPEVQRILPEYSLPPLGIYAVYPQQKYLSLKVRVLIDFLVHQCQHLENRK